MELHNPHKLDFDTKVQKFVHIYEVLQTKTSFRKISVCTNPLFSTRVSRLSEASGSVRDSFGTACGDTLQSISTYLAKYLHMFGQVSVQPIYLKSFPHSEVLSSERTKRRPRLLFQPPPRFTRFDPLFDCNLNFNSQYLYRYTHFGKTLFLVKQDFKDNPILARSALTSHNYP